MTAKAQQRWLIGGGIVALAVVLWLLLRGRAPGGVTVDQAGNVSVPGVPPLPGLAGLPAVTIGGSNLNYVGGSKGCVLCYSGYQRLEPPTPAPAYSPRSPEVIYNYVMTTAPRTYSMGGPP